MQKQAGGEGVNLASIGAAVLIVVILGGWFAWAAGVGGNEMPSNFRRMTQTAAFVSTLNPTTLAGEIRQTPFYYGLIPLTPGPSETPAPDVEQLIQATQTRWWQGGTVPTVEPTATALCSMDYGADDPCLQLYIEAGLSPDLYYDRWTPQVSTAIPTVRTFVTWTPTPDVRQLSQEIQATIHVMAQATALALTPRAEERTPERFSDGGAPHAARLPSMK